ncbi:hypothetical protein [Streptomyces harbinensis]
MELTPEQLESLAVRISELLPGYLLRRDPPQIPPGAPELGDGDGDSDVSEPPEEIIIEPGGEVGE